MNIEGQLTIQLTFGDNGIHCKISSSRPLHASRIFIGKPIDTVLQTLPLLFNICGKAQVIAALRAAESLLNQQVEPEVESQREALIWLESLREQLWQIILEYPQYLGENVDTTLITQPTQAINQLSQVINKNGNLLTRAATANSIKQQKTWQTLKQTIEKNILAASSQQWLDTAWNIDDWANQQQSLAARFVFWLQQQTWKQAGASLIPALSNWDDQQLQQRLYTEGDSFTHLPDWNGMPHEVSWFTQQLHHPLLKSLSEECGNGIYTRVIARLIGIADLVQQLDNFFAGERKTLAYPANNGIAHVNAARGRLTHAIKMSGEMVERLHILAPTEWNFHPNGATARGLENLQDTTTKELEQQAHCLIHAIDPCVGYTLSVTAPALA